jgi:hypothetical protein
LAEAIRLHASLDTLLEQHLHPDADPQDRPATGESLVHQRRSVDRCELLHHRRKGTDPRDDESVRTSDLAPVGREFHPRACFLKGLGRGMDISAAVVENHNEW